MSSLTAVSREGVGDGQRLTCADVAVWHHLRAYVAIREAEQARGSMWETLTAHGARAREAKTSGSAWERVWCIFWPFLVGFFSELAVLSLYTFILAVGWAERWYLRVARTVGVTAVTHLCQWLLEEGKGSGRTSEISTGTRKSEELLWYHVKNIKWERKTE